MTGFVAGWFVGAISCAIVLGMFHTALDDTRRLEPVDEEVLARLRERNVETHANYGARRWN